TSSSFEPLANGAISRPPPPPSPLTPVQVLAAAPKRQLASDAMYDSSKISSVYFDNKQLDVYHERLVRVDGASLVRIRWYGVDAPAPEQGVFVERKKHRDAWTGEFSLK
ncbi:hypothetical protein VaNZ11_006790, partial [Volvox africanus]